MGWFSSSNDAPTQQFGAPSTFGAPAMGMGGGMMMNNGMAGQMDPMAMQQMAQNPMMQAMANDPVQATARLLQYNDPIAAFIQTNSMGLLMDLFSEMMTLAMKDFFANVSFKTDAEGNITLDVSTLPTNLVSMSAENIRLTMQSLQTGCMQQTQMNQQQIQMLLSAHNPISSMLNGQQQPGFFGSLLGGMIGNQANQMGGYGAMGAGAAALL
jgi:hypothetical protein|tara:strand:+ start:346 stop:981 length:636 start_codon:yes stop_codon:yes gene_type:complete